MGAVLIWSTMAATVKMFAEDLPDLELLCAASVFGALFLLVLTVCSGRIRLIKQYSLSDWLETAGTGIFLFLYNALYYFGLGRLSAQEGCIINYLWPLMTVLFACIIMKEPFTTMKIVAMICSFIGIIIITVSNGAGGIGSGAFIGRLSCFGGASCYGLFSVLNKKQDRDQYISMVVYWLVTAVCSLLFGQFGEPWKAISSFQWIGVFWIGLFVNAAANILWAFAINGSGKKTAVIANLAYLVPFFSLFVTLILLGEKITIYALFALAFIVGGILLQSRSERA